MRFSTLTKSWSAVIAFLLVAVMGFAQGVTNSSMNGRVIDTNGEALIGANVLAVHTPSGTTYGNSTDLDGFFRIRGMRVGGPYKITISYTGYADDVKENIFLSLGQAYQLNVTLSESAIDLADVVVLAVRNDQFDGNKTGQETVVDEKLINEIPTISRAIGDYARYNPLATIGENDDGFTVSLAGQNNRYNTIYIDGAVNNDVFGLAGSGTNGGQTGVQPVSIDAIEQFQISIAPFDVRQSGFAGGSINAVTRSGTNEFEGSAYFFHRNENLAGKTPTDRDDAVRTRLADFTASTYGFRLGGPLIKDKLFFFVNAELQRDETPQPFDFADYDGNSNLDTINLIAQKVRNDYGYDVGTFDNNTSFLDSEKFLAKIDWNINQKHKLSLRHSYVSAENLEARRSDAENLNFINGSEFFKTTTNSTALEITSFISNNISNNFTFGATIVRDDRDPSGDPFPTVRIADGDDVNINFGAERFSTANLLNQDVFTINNDLEFYKGRHSFLVGVNVEFFSAGNLFIRNNYGRYLYDNGVEAFLNGDPAETFERSFSQVDNQVGDDSDAIADFKQTLVGIYIQDEFQATENLKITAGIRADFSFWPTDQPVNEEFNNTTIPMIESFGYDLKGAKTGQFIDTRPYFSPRIGFNYDITGDKRNQLRGGVGIFTSRIPLVWPGGAYNNYGFNIGEVVLEDVPFQPDINQQQPGEIDPSRPAASGQVDLFATDFDLPQVFKANLAYDRKLPWGLIGTAEVLYTKNINAVRYQNLNLRPSTENLTGTPDDRPIFDGVNARFGNPIDPTYTNIMLASNTSKGYAYNLAFTLTKPFDNGFTGSVSYSYGDSYQLFDGTSSQNNSQWRGYYNPEGRNFEGEAFRSRFSQGHRVSGQVGYELEYFNFGRSKLSLNFNAQSGEPFTYVIGARNFQIVDDGGFDFNELVYVPNNASEINLVPTTVSGVEYSAEQQWALLDQYISDNKSLDDFRGGYADRNSARLPFNFNIDLRFLQDFKIEMANGKENILQLSLDIFNFTNLINKDWGRVYNFRFDTYSLLNFRGFEDGTNTPTYTINNDLINDEDPWEGNIDDSGFRSSRWQMQIGVRYIFQ